MGTEEIHMSMSTQPSWEKPSTYTILITLMGISAAILLLVNARIPSRSISPAQLKKLANQTNVFLINIHTPYQGEIEHTDTFIDEAHLFPNELLPKNLHTPIILYDLDGKNAPFAAKNLRTIGFTNVHYLQGGMNSWERHGGKRIDLSTLEKIVLPESGIELPIAWGTLGKQLVDAGIINLPEFRKAVPLTPEQEQLLTKGSDDYITINAQNSQFVVDVLWALGLAQKSTIYTDGPMGNEEKKEIGNFASTGGWNLGRELATNYINKYDFITLDASQHARVADIAHHVYRPCCNNSTWFPDCNHGMAALAVIELLVSQNVDDAMIYKKILGFNSFWFPDSYLTIASYFMRQGIAWDKVDAKEVLGFPYSSSTGASKIMQITGPLPFKTNFAGGCGA